MTADRDKLLALAERVLAEAADYLDGYGGGHYMAKSCATALRDDGVALELADRAVSALAGER